MSIKKCKKCEQELDLELNFSKVSINSKYYRGQCNSCRSKIESERYLADKSVKRKYAESYKLRRNMLRNQRRKNDTQYRITRNLRDRIRKVLKTNTKTSPTLILLGCSIKNFKKHLQQTAIKNGYKDFDINDYSSQDYHIDHIKPCSSFDLSKESEQKKCFHYSNMQILTAKDNMIKSDN